MNHVDAAALFQVGGVLLFAICVVALLNKLGGERYLLFNNLRGDIKTLRRFFKKQ